MLGALLEQLGVLSVEDVKESLKIHIPEHRRNMLEGNLKALERGASIISG
jgi:Pyruvate/2-oxoacid:ferredoxin oxidoreductase gamma subunit